MKKGQKRGAGWRIAKDGQVNVQFKLNALIEEEKELLDLLQYWRQHGMMKSKFVEALKPMYALEVQGLTRTDSIVVSKLGNLENMVGELLTRPAAVSLPQSSSGSAKPLGGGLKPIAMPTFDDSDTLIVNVDKNAGANTTANFLDAAFGFQEQKEQ